MFVNMTTESLKESWASVKLLKHFLLSEKPPYLDHLKHVSIHKFLIFW